MGRCIDFKRIFEYREGNLYYKECNPDDYSSKAWAMHFNTKMAGKIATTLDKNCGRNYVCYRGKKYSNSRVTWMVLKGEIPEGLEIDHENRKPSDDRIENLRLADRSMQNINRIFNRDLPKGVYLASNGKGYRVRVWKDGKHIGIGTYSTVNTASEAYIAAVDRVRGER